MSHHYADNEEAKNLFNSLMSHNRHITKEILTYRTQFKDTQKARDTLRNLYFKNIGCVQKKQEELSIDIERSTESRKDIGSDYSLSKYLPNSAIIPREGELKLQISDRLQNMSQTDQDSLKDSIIGNGKRMNQNRIEINIEQPDQSPRNYKSIKENELSCSSSKLDMGGSKLKLINKSINQISTKSLRLDQERSVSMQSL